MGLEYGAIGLGQFKSPLLTSILTPAREILDPNLNSIADFIKGMLDIHLLDYWTALLALEQFQPLAQFKDSIIAEFVLYDPSFYFRENQYKFPLAALSRVKEEFTEKTIHYNIWTGTLKFQYILPPLTVDQANSITHFLNAVKVVLGDRFKQGYDPQYMGGIKPLKPYFSAIGVESASFGVLEFKEKSNLFFPTLELDIFFEEIREPRNDEFDNFEGLDGYQGLINAGEDPVENFIEFQLDV